MTDRWRLGGVVAMVVLSMACAVPSPAAPPGSDRFSGTWTGQVTDDEGGTGTARLVLTQSGNGIGGSYSALFAGSVTVDGTVSGTAVGSTATFVITPAVPVTCAAGLVLQGALSTTLVVAGDRASGQYTGLTCGGARSGRLELRRQ